MSQTGRTTQQMLTAPKGAVYIWPTNGLIYPRRLAEHLGRDDLLIYGSAWLIGDRLYGHAKLSVVLDHAIWVSRLGPGETATLEHLRSRGQLVE